MSRFDQLRSGLIGFGRDRISQIDFKRPVTKIVRELENVAIIALICSNLQEPNLYVEFDNIVKGLV